MLGLCRRAGRDKARRRQRGTPGLSAGLFFILSPFGGHAEGAPYPIAGQQPAAETDRNPARYPMPGRRPLLLSMREVSREGVRHTGPDRIAKA
jgi:hypothetical protein